MSVEKIINNVKISLKKIGLNNVNVRYDQNEKIVYIFFNVNDLLKLINKKVRNNIKKVNPNLKSITTLHNENVFIIIKINAKHEK